MTACCLNDSALSIHESVEILEVQISSTSRALWIFVMHLTGNFSLRENLIVMLINLSGIKFAWQVRLLLRVGRWSMGDGGSKIEVFGEMGRYSGLSDESIERSDAKR